MFATYRFQPTVPHDETIGSPMTCLRDKSKVTQKPDAVISVAAESVTY